MLLSALLLSAICWSPTSGAESFFYEVHGSVLGVPEEGRSTKAVEAKFSADVLTTLLRSDIKLDVIELKSNYGIYTSSAIFHGYITTSVSNRAELILLLQSVPTLAFAYVAPKDSIPPSLKTSRYETLASVQCSNDAIPLPNNTCRCPPYTGGTQCDVVYCQNFGIASGSRCVCPPGYYSRYCENRGFRPAIENDLDISKRSLVIVFSLAASMQQDFASFRASLPAMVDGLEGSGADITSFVFWGFVLTDTITLTYYIGYGKKLSDLDLMFDLLVFSTPAKQQPFLTQIAYAQQFYTDTRAFSNVLFFADTGASDASDPNDFFSRGTDEHLVISGTNTWHNKLTLILTQTPTRPLNTSGNDFDVYRRLALATHGDLFVIDKTNVSEVMTNVLNNYHYMENLAVRYKFNCTDMKQFDVPREYNSSKTIKILLTVDKNDANPVDFDWPFLTDMNYNQLGLISRTKYYSFYGLTTEATSIRVVSPTPGLVCSLRVFVDSNNAVLLSFTNNRQMDIGNYNMCKSIPQLATGLPLGFSGFDHLEMRPLESSTGLGLSVTTQAYKRSQDATYAYEFDNLADCTAGPYIQQVQIMYGNGVATRVLPGYCALPGPPFASSVPDEYSAAVSAISNQCTQMNINAIVDPRQHEFRQVVFAVENSVTMSEAADSLLHIINTTVNQIDKAFNKQFSMILFDDTRIRFVSSTFFPDVFINQCSVALTEVVDSQRTLQRSRSLEVIYKVSQISLLSPTILHLFTSTPPTQISNYVTSLPRDLQVNIFTLRNDSNVVLDENLAYNQRASGGRSLPVTADGLLGLSPLLVSSVNENSLILDHAVQDCSASDLSILNVEDVATVLVINVVGVGVHRSDMVSLNDPSGSRVDVANKITFMDQNTVTFSINVGDMNIPNRAIPWSLLVTTTAGPCFVQVRAVSPLTVIPGFITNSANDFPDNSPFSVRGSDRHIYAVFRVPDVQYTVEQVSVGPASIGQPWLDSTTLSAFAVSARDISSCSYQYISNNFEMTTSSLSRMEVTGRTPSNAFYRRTFYFQQVNAFASICNHGSPNTYGECVCNPGYTGDFCDQPFCDNGGTRSMSICLCSTGFYGPLCEQQVPNQFSSTVTSAKTIATSKSTTPPPIAKGATESLIYCSLIIIFFSLMRIL